MKNNKIIIIALTIFLIIFMCIPIFALNNIGEYFKNIPSDLGDRIYLSGNASSLDAVEDMYYKFYIKITINSSADNSAPIIYKIKNDIEEYTINFGYNYNNGKFYSVNLNSTYVTNNNTINIQQPIFNVDAQLNDTFYIPLYTYNISYLRFSNNIVYNGFTYELYRSTTTDQNTLINEAYNIGYNNGYFDGYNQGLTDYPGAHDDWNLVQHMQHAIGFFIGDEYAQYVTPFSIAFTILMAYFIFIRWIFLFGKSQKALRVADIVVIVACICVMAVMYINMLTINIQNTNLTDSVESSSEVIRNLVPENIYKYIDDTKIESVYKIVDDVRIGG